MTNKTIGIILGLPSEAIKWTTADWNRVFDYKDK